MLRDKEREKERRAFQLQTRAYQQNITQTPFFRFGDVKILSCFSLRRVSFIFIYLFILINESLRGG